MTISSTTAKSGPYNGNGATTNFAFNFKAFSEDDLEVTLTSSAGVDTVKTITTHYTVSLGASSGTVTMLTAPASGEKLTIRLKRDAVQETDLTNQGGYVGETVERALDNVTQYILEDREKIGRALLTPVTDSTIGELPSATDRADKVFAFDSSGDPVAQTLGDMGQTFDVTISGGDAGKLVGVNDGETALEIRTAAQGRTALGLGTIATQAADSVNIDGGAIDGTAIGATTPAAGTFTTVSGSGAGLTGVLLTGTYSIPIPASAMIPRATNGAAYSTKETTTNNNLSDYMGFDGTTQEYAGFTLATPKGWDEGSLTFHALWSHPSTTVNFGVVWSLSAVAVGDDDALDVAFGTAQTSTDTGGTTDDLYHSPTSSAITIAGTPAAEDLVQFQITRLVNDGSDTLGVDARLHAIVIKITYNGANDA